MEVMCARSVSVGSGRGVNEWIIEKQVDQEVIGPRLVGRRIKGQLSPTPVFLSLHSQGGPAQHLAYLNSIVIVKL